MNIVLEDIKAWAESNKPKKEAKKGKIEKRSEHDAGAGFDAMAKKKPKPQIQKDIEEWAKNK